MIFPRDIGIIADDLTGACDVASCFTPVTGSVEVLVSDYSTWSLTADLTVINTQSRDFTSDRCFALLQRIGVLLKSKPVLFKKIDTALRGPVGAELEGLVKGTENRTAIVAPAIPRIGRTTKDGIQFDQGVPITHTEYANDPVSPVKIAKISQKIQETGNVECVIRDAETDEDLQSIVKEGLKNKKIIFVGSIGLANALAAEVRPIVTEVQKRSQSFSKRLLVICGSNYKKSRVQLEKALENQDAQLVTIDPNSDTKITVNDVYDLANNEKIQVEQEDKREKAIIICMSKDIDLPGMSSGQLLYRFVSNVKELVIQLKPDVIAIIGGETAYSLLKQLSVNTLSVLGRITDVMPYGKILDGLLKGCFFITKGGSVGSPDSVLRMIRFFTKEG
jgi:uncharacterized protein YgbK (DUF1537 family)